MGPTQPVGAAMMSALLQNAVAISRFGLALR
jgi:hypothetical protein